MNRFVVLSCGQIARLDSDGDIEMEVYAGNADGVGYVFLTAADLIKLMTLIGGDRE